MRGLCGDSSSPTWRRWSRGMEAGESHAAEGGQVLAYLSAPDGECPAAGLTAGPAAGRLSLTAAALLGVEREGDHWPFPPSWSRHLAVVLDQH